MENDVLAHERRCPFYGCHFSEKMRVLIGHNGNQCGLITDSYSPCRMEIEGLRVDWEKCPLNNMDNSRRFNSMLESTSVIQENFQNAISFKDFYSKVMG